MATQSVDLFVVGGGINGAATARDAAGRGMRVMLAERNDYASATSSASSKLIHGGLRYLETFEFGLVRESLRERDILLKTAPHLVEPLRFLVPIRDDQRRPPWTVYLGLKLYDVLAGSKSVAPSGRLSAAQIVDLAHLRKTRLDAVFHYTDCRTDDARFVLALLFDARDRGAEIANYCDVVEIKARPDGYRVSMTENGKHREVDARYVVNAAGPWANALHRLCDRPPPERALRLVRGSHIVLPMPEPRQAVAYTLQNEDGRVVFTLPWLDDRYLVIGTTDAPHVGDPSDAACSHGEREYLLAAYNRYFEGAAGAASAGDVVADWAGVRALADDGHGNPSKVTRSAHISHIAQGTGGMVSIYGGKLTTHRHLAEQVLDRLARMGAKTGATWTDHTLLPGGELTLDERAALADQGPDSVSGAVRRRWVRTYGAQAHRLFDMISDDPALAKPIAAGIAEAELIHARDEEHARCADDFLRRRTKLFIDTPASDRDRVEDWFGE